MSCACPFGIVAIEYFGEALCDTPAQGLIGYSYQQVATSFPEAGLQRTPRLNVLGPEKFGDG